MVDEMLAAGARCFSDRLLRLTLGADEQDLAASRNGVGDKVECPCEQRHALREVKNMDAVAGAEDIWFHLRVPAVGLVAEMRSGFNQLL